MQHISESGLQSTGLTFTSNVAETDTPKMKESSNPGGFTFAGVPSTSFPLPPPNTNTANPGFVFGMPISGVNMNKQNEQKQYERFPSACAGIQQTPPHPFVFGYEKKKDNNAAIKAIYDELSAIRSQIEYLTKATDNIYKIVSQIQ